MKLAAWDILMCSISTTGRRDPKLRFREHEYFAPSFAPWRQIATRTPSHLGNQHDEKVAAKLSLDAAYSKTEAQCNPPHDPRGRHCAHIAGRTGNRAAATCNFDLFFDSGSRAASSTRRALLVANTTKIAA
jgi:hypothetical protein